MNIGLIKIVLNCFYLRIKLIIPNTKPKLFLDYIRIEVKFNIFWYKNGTGSHEKHHNSLIINYLGGERGIRTPGPTDAGQLISSQSRSTTPAFLRCKNNNNAITRKHRFS